MNISGLKIIKLNPLNINDENNKIVIKNNLKVIKV